MEEEVEFVYEMLHPHSPTCVRVWLPKGPPKFDQVPNASVRLPCRILSHTPSLCTHSPAMGWQRSSSAWGMDACLLSTR